jgi:hypothetical protein
VSAAAAAPAAADDDNDDDDPDPELVNYLIVFFCIPFKPPPNPTMLQATTYPSLSLAR